MKSVLISIQPKWCELIASGKKTIEVRKTKPKLETPFKVYIYCTKGDKNFFPPIKKPIYRQPNYVDNPMGNGKVIGEFVCDHIGYVRNYGDMVDSYDCIASCLSANEIIEYAKDKNGNFVYTYGWHISNLVIYDKPRELSEFSKYGFSHPVWLKRPPQSWCYVESEVDTE
jgi:predicted transcriptional regulator